MEDLNDGEELITCPYEKSHQIRRCKMQWHLVKCKKNYADFNLISCDFNASHMIAEPELQYHHKNCPDRKKIESQIISAQPQTENRFPIPSVLFNTQSDETWDDLDCPSYNPTAYVEKSQVLRHLDVESKGKRKQFHIMERLRHSELRNNKRDLEDARETKPKGVPLPPHRTVTHIEGSSDRATLLEKVRMGRNKVNKM